MTLLRQDRWFTLFLLPNCDSRGRLCRNRHSHSLAFPTSRHRLQFRLLTLPCRIPRTELLLVTFSYLLLKICSGSLTNIATSQWLAHSYTLLHHYIWFTLRNCYICNGGSLKLFVTSRSLVHSAPMLHNLCWFTLRYCYIQPCGSLSSFVTSRALVHYEGLLHPLKWFTIFYCNIN